MQFNIVLFSIALVLVIALVFSVLKFSRLRYPLLYMFVLRFILGKRDRAKNLLRDACAASQVKIYPVFDSQFLNEYGLQTNPDGIVFDLWNDLELKNGERYSIDRGVNVPIVGQPNFFGKSSFFDPEDLKRFSLWYGCYMVPLNHVTKIEDGEKKSYRNFGYDSENQTINIEHFLALIFYDFVGYFLFANNYQRSIEEVKKIAEFKQSNFAVEKHETIENCWIVEGSVLGRNYLSVKEEVLKPGAWFQGYFGWAPNSSEVSKIDTTITGQLVITFRDETGNIVAPQDAEVLAVGYVFGSVWDDGKKQTPKAVFEGLTKYLLEMKYLPV